MPFPSLDQFTPVMVSGQNYFDNVGDESSVATSVIIPIRLFLWPTTGLMFISVFALKATHVIVLKPAVVFGK